MGTIMDTPSALQIAPKYFCNRLATCCTVQERLALVSCFNKNYEIFTHQAVCLQLRIEGSRLFMLFYVLLKLQLS